MIFAAALRELMAAGLTGDALIAAMERIEAAALPRRTSAAIRQERYRRNKASQSVTVTPSPPDKEKSPTPPKEINPPPLASLAPLTARATPRSELERVLDGERAQAVIDHRQRLRKPLTTHAAKLLAGKFARCRDPCAAADAMIANGWQGFEPEWMESRTGSANGNGTGKAHGKRNPYDALFGALADQFAPGTGQGGQPPDADAELHDEPGAAQGDRGQTVDLGAGDYRRAK